MPFIATCVDTIGTVFWDRPTEIQSVLRYLQSYSQSRRPHSSQRFHDFDWYNSCVTEKCPLTVNGATSKNSV